MAITKINPYGPQWDIYADTSPFRWYDAVGQNVTKFEALVGDTPTTAERYTLTVTGSTPTVAGATTIGDRLLLTTVAAEYSGVNLQTVGTPFAFASNKPLYFGGKLTMGRTDMDLLFGLYKTQTAMMATSSAHALAATGDGFYFYKLAGATTIFAGAEIAGAQKAATLATAMDTSAHTYEFIWDGNTTLSAYFDGALVSTITSGFSAVSTVLCPSINVRTGAGGLSTCKVAWWKVIQLA